MNLSALFRSPSLMGALLIPLHGPPNGHDVIAEQWSDTLTVELGVGWLLTADAWRRLVIEGRLLGTGRPQAGHGLSNASGSLSQVSAHTSAVDAAAREELERVLSSMSQKLKSQKYNGSYFDRGAEASERLCTPEGWFLLPE